MICVGIDIAKGKSTVCFLKPGGEVLRAPYDIIHTAEEITKLIRDIRSYDEEVRVVLEATGHYHLPVVAQLLEANIFVCVVNALRMKKFCSQDIRKAKTDKIDAAKIAAFGLTYWQDLQQSKPTDEVYRELRLLSRQYFQLTSMLVKAKISLGNLLDNVMPGITDILQDREPHHKLTDFVLKYLHFGKISAMGEKKFILGYCAWAKKQGYRMYERQAEEIFALVQNSIPALPMTPSTTIVIKEAIKVVRELENSRASILAQMQAFAKSLPEYSLIREMACVGDTLTPLVIAEIGDVRNFHSKHALVAYAGIDAPPYQSGGFYGTERHISKRGNGYLRHVGFEIMQCKLRLKPEGDVVYMNAQLIARHGEIENYDFIEFNTSYGRVTEKYLPETAHLQTDLRFYTRREALESFSSSCVITIHYQSEGGILSGIRDFPLIGTEDAVKSCVKSSLSLLLVAFILSAMVLAVLIVLSVLKRTAKFVPELIMNCGVLMIFLSWYISSSATSVPLFWSGINNSSLFILIGAAILSVGRNFKKAPLKSLLVCLSSVGAIAAFCLPFVSFGTAEFMCGILTALKAVGIVFIAIFVGINALDAENAASVLKPICAVLIGVASATSLFLTPSYLVQRNPLFWIYITVMIADFITIFRIFMNTEKSNVYLTQNLNLEVERQVKDIRSVISERDKLLQFVSHDMKKPLDFSAVLIDNLIEREENEEQVKALNIVKKNTDRVLANLSELASYAHYNYIAEPSQTLNIKDLFASLYKYCSADCEACGIILKNLVTEEYHVFAKKQGLENAVTNIILNAVEHSGCTEIELTARAEKNKIVLEITDNGKGISPDIDIFKPYVSENKPDSGGLGLYICKNIIESMNGELSYLRRNGETVFMIVLLKA